MATSPLMIEARQKMALAMLESGMDTTPVKHWAQGLARVANALMGGYMAGQDRRDQEEAQKISIFGTPTAASSATPSTASVSSGPTAPVGAASGSPAPVADVSAMAAALKARGAQNMANGTAPAPMNAPIPAAEPAPVGMSPQARIDQAFGATPFDRAIATRTVLGEAANEGPTGMQAVANVIANRARDGGYGGTSMAEVARAPNQFEPWNTAAGRNRMMSVAQASAPYQTAQQAVDNAGVGGQPDITGGAKYFYAPEAQKQLASVDGRPVVPSFANQQPTAVIGGHNFYGERGQQPAPQQPPSTQVAQAQSSSAPQSQASLADLQSRVDAMKNHPNPYVRQKAAEYQQAIDTQRLSQILKGNEYDIQQRPDGTVIAVNKRNPSDMQVINAPGAGQSAIKFEADKAAAVAKSKGEAEKLVGKEQRDREAAQTANIVIQDIDRALAGVDTATIPVTGMTGNIASYIPGTTAHDVSKLVDTVKANAGFAELQKMRNNSPTGGALGQVSEREIAYLQSTIGNLEQSQTEQQFKDNLRRVKNVYLDIIHGPGNGPRESLQFQQQKSSEGWRDLGNGVRIREKR